MSASPLKADMLRVGIDVRLVPTADIAPLLRFTRRRQARAAPLRRIAAFRLRHRGHVDRYRCHPDCRRRGMPAAMDEPFSTATFLVLSPSHHRVCPWDAVHRASVPRSSHTSLGRPTMCAAVRARWTMLGIRRPSTMPASSDSSLPLVQACPLRPVDERGGIVHPS